MEKEENTDSDKQNDEVVDSSEQGTLNSDNTTEEVQKTKVEELESEAKENHNKYLRAMADLENYKKRVLKERAELIKYSGESVIKDFLDVLDDLDRASKVESDSVNDVLDGIKLIAKRFEGIFKKHSVESKDYLGEQFDPNCHEALTAVPTDEHEPGVVMEQLKKAYFFKDKLIRPAQVVVSSKKEE